MEVTEHKFSLTEARAIAERVVELLAPHCERLAIAGSIRREKALVGDIEIVAIPQPYEIDMFASGLAPIVNGWRKLKGDLQYNKCKYTQRLLPEGIKLDLFFATNRNWGWIMALRTGSADFARYKLLRGLKDAGYEASEGVIWANGQECWITEEEEIIHD
jgi:DNA polymerase/3'-5' exonuclease PolX